MMLVRKSVVCGCGCRGWCTYHSILCFLHWILCCIAAGQHPASRHDGSEFDEVADAVRVAAKGTLLRFKGALIHLKGDWAEFVERFGFPTWASSYRPCFCCNAFGATMYDPVGISLEDDVWRTNEDVDYDVACGRCEIWVTVQNAGAHAEMCNALQHDKRDKGARGLGLTKDLPQYNPPLLAGWSIVKPSSYGLVQQG